MRLTDRMLAFNLQSEERKENVGLNLESEVRVIKRAPTTSFVHCTSTFTTSTESITFLDVLFQCFAKIEGERKTRYKYVFMLHFQA